MMLNLYLKKTLRKRLGVDVDLEYIQGDIFQHLETDFPIMMSHCCNDIGAFGAGFVTALSNKWAEPEIEYKKWKYSGKVERFNKVRPFCLGEVDYVNVSKSPIIFVANMIGQRGVVSSNNHKPIRYLSLANCMDDVAHTINGMNNYMRKKNPDKFKPMQIFCPKFGAGLAQGNWNVIEELINEIWVDRGIQVTVFVI